MIELEQIGHSGKSKGVRGELKLHVNGSYRTDLKSARALFFNLDGSKVPFLIEQVYIDPCIIKLDEIDSPEAAYDLSNKEIFLEVKELQNPNTSPSDSGQHALVEFTLIDQNDSRIGTISSVKEYPNQLLAEVNINDIQVLIPIHEDLILELNEASKFIKMEIADGLLDL